MFDIKKFLTENKVTLSEAGPDDKSKYTAMDRKLTMARAKVKDVSRQYLSFPDKKAILAMRQAMQNYERAVVEKEQLMKSLPRRAKVPNPRNRLS